MSIDIFYLLYNKYGDCMGLTFGEKIKYLREEKNVTQAQLGTCVHMTQRKISYIECGKCEPSMEDLREFCLFFSVSADFLLDLPDNLAFPE